MNKFFRKRQILLPVLVLVLAAAIYINWQFAGRGNTDNSAVTSADDNLGEAEYVANQNVSVSAQTELQQYFINARADRERARNDAMAELDQIEANVKATDEQISAAVKLRMFMASFMESEANIETLVKAKGFSDCVAVINSDSVNLVVASDALSQSEILQIQDIVVSQYEISLDKIKVINIE